MVQGGGSPRFPSETFQHWLRMPQVFGQELQRNETVKTNIFSLENHTHSAAAELFQDAIVRYGLADHTRHNPSGLQW
jgi:hypothetical protein